MKPTDNSPNKPATTSNKTAAIGGVKTRSTPRKILHSIPEIISESQDIEIITSSDTNESELDLTPLEVPDTLSSQVAESFQSKTSSPFTSKGIKIAPCDDMLKNCKNMKDEWDDDTPFLNIETNEGSPQAEEQVILGYDDHDCNHEFQQNAQRFTPESISLLADCVEIGDSPPPPTSKGQHIRSAKRRLEIDEETEIQPWIKASNHLRQMKWQHNALQKIHRTKFVQKDSAPNNEISLYYSSTSMSTFFVRINADAGISKKVSIGTKGNRPLKIEFDSIHLDKIISSLSSVINGSIFKKLNIGVRGEELTLETQGNESLKISNNFPEDARKLFESRGMNDYHVQKNVSFSIPKSEVNTLMESLLDTKRFATFLKDLFEQEFRVFEQVQMFYKDKCGTFSTKEYYLKCVEIFHSMETQQEKQYPIYLVLENFMRKFEKMPYAFIRD